MKKIVFQLVIFSMLAGILGFIFPENASAICQKRWFYNNAEGICKETSDLYTESGDVGCTPLTTCNTNLTNTTFFPQGALGPCQISRLECARSFGSLQWYYEADAPHRHCEQTKNYYRVFNGKIIELEWGGECSTNVKAWSDDIAGIRTTGICYNSQTTCLNGNITPTTTPIPTATPTLIPTIGPSPTPTAGPSPTPSICTPTTPSELKFTCSGARVTLTWKAATCAEGYYVSANDSKNTWSFSGDCDVDNPEGFCTKIVASSYTQNSDSTLNYKWGVRSYKGAIKGNEVVSTFTCGSFKQGDLNFDGKVNIFDYNLFVADFNKSGTAGFVPADINKDGKVGIFDYNMLVANFGK